MVAEASVASMRLTRPASTLPGPHSTMVVTGDPNQSDLLPEISGLAPVAARLEALGNVAVVRLGDRDIVRHPLVAEMLGVL